MKSIMYDSFLSELARGRIDLTERNIFKVCLLKESIYAALMDRGCRYTYFTIANAGMECRDSKEKDESDPYGYLEGRYPEGGKYVSFTETPVPVYKYIDYFSDDVVFYNVSLDSDNAARYALLYRGTDGLIMSLYDLGSPVTVEDDSLILQWKGSPVMRIGSSSSASLNMDDALDGNSTNALSNRRIVEALDRYSEGMKEALRRYGVLVGEESYDEGDDGIDRISSLTDSDIDNLFPSSAEG